MPGICLMYFSGMGSAWLPYQRKVIFMAVSPYCINKLGRNRLISGMKVISSSATIMHR